jgi:hypothetical protein
MVGRDFFLFFKIFFLIYECVLNTEVESMKSVCNRKIRPHGTLNVFTAFWLVLLTHSDINCPKSKRGSF